MLLPCWGHSNSDNSLRWNYNLDIIFINLFTCYPTRWMLLLFALDIFFIFAFLLTGDLDFFLGFDATLFLLLRILASCGGAFASDFIPDAAFSDSGGGFFKLGFEVVGGGACFVPIFLTTSFFFFFGLFVLAAPVISLLVEELTSAPSAMDEDCISEIMPSP